MSDRSLYIQVLNALGVGLDKGAARRYFAAHQKVKNKVGSGSVINLNL